MLQACIDDSGHRSGPMFLLGALVAPASSWISFTAEWHQELAQRPSVRYFKLQDAVRSYSEFANTSSHPELVKYKIDRLSAITQRHVTHAVDIALDISDFNRYFRPQLETIENHGNPDRSELRGISSPYFLLAWAMIRRLDWSLLDGDLNIVFDEQASDGIRVQEWWPEVAKSFNSGRTHHKLHERPDYRSDQKYAPLQAANSFAWLRNRVHEGEPRMIGATLQPPTMAEFLGGIKHESYLLNAVTLAKMRDAFAAHERPGPI